MSRPLICNLCEKTIVSDTFIDEGEAYYASMAVLNLDDGYNSEPNHYHLDICGKCLNKILDKEVIITKGDIS